MSFSVSVCAFLLSVLFCCVIVSMFGLFCLSSVIGLFFPFLVIHCVLFSRLNIIPVYCNYKPGPEPASLRRWGIGGSTSVAAMFSSSSSAEGLPYTHTAHVDRRIGTKCPCFAPGPCCTLGRALARFSRAQTFRAHGSEGFLTIILVTNRLQHDYVDTRRQYDAYAGRHGLEQAWPHQRSGFGTCAPFACPASVGITPLGMLSGCCQPTPPFALMFAAASVGDCPGCTGRPPTPAFAPECIFHTPRCLLPVRVSHSVRERLGFHARCAHGSVSCRVVYGACVALCHTQD